MKKVVLVSLIVALVGALILPAVYTPAPVMASSSISCAPGELNFIVYEGVPTTLLGFIPLESQTLTVNSNGGWTAGDDADWLSFFPGLAFSGQDMNVWISGDLAVGTYTATITVTPFFSRTSVEVPVTVEVIEPAVLGPLGIGVDKDLLKNLSGGEIIAEENEYSGIVANLLTNPADMMDMQAIETDGSWSLNFSRGADMPDGSILLTGGTLTINGETQQIIGGGVAPISMLMTMMGGGGGLPIPADFDWGENYAALFATSGGQQYVGILLADLTRLLDLLPMLEGMFSTEEAGTDMNGAPPAPNSNTGDPDNAPTASADMVIPLSPILNLLPSLMPVMTDLLGNETIMAILTPLMEALPPIMIIMPYNLLMQLVIGLM